MQVESGLQLCSGGLTRFIVYLRRLQKNFLDSGFSLSIGSSVTTGPASCLRVIKWHWRAVTHFWRRETSMFSCGFTLPKLRSGICCLAPGGIPVCCAHRGTWMVLGGDWVNGGRGGSDKKKQNLRKKHQQCRFAFNKKKTWRCSCHIKKLMYLF